MFRKAEIEVVTLSNNDIVVTSGEHCVPECGGDWPME